MPVCVVCMVPISGLLVRTFGRICPYGELEGIFSPWLAWFRQPGSIGFCGFRVSGFRVSGF